MRSSPFFSFSNFASAGWLASSEEGVSSFSGVICISTPLPLQFALLDDSKSAPPDRKSIKGRKDEKDDVERRRWRPIGCQAENQQPRRQQSPSPSILLEKEVAQPGEGDREERRDDCFPEGLRSGRLSPASLPQGALRRAGRPLRTEGSTLSWQGQRPPSIDRRSPQSFCRPALSSSRLAPRRY